MFSDFLIDFFCIILTVNLLGIALLSALRIYFIQKSSRSNFFKLETNEPLISIHFAICNEPPEMVLETLKSFVGLNYSNFEVIIISNNTSNEKSWKPIKSFSKSIPNFKFFHYDKVKGYKAGALNIALTKMNPDSKYIFTVDSDYKLDTDALKVCIGSIESRELDVLQFPQDYSNVCSNTDGLQVNYKHYFECYLSAMDSEKFGLPTGTLTLVKAIVFEKGHRWPTETITEDAHFGVELLSSNFKIGYCNISIGKGTMPTNVSDYSKQFKRWIFGNFQTLILSLNNKGINVKNKLRLFTMLTAWINFLAIPIVLSFISIPFIITEAEHINMVYMLIIISLFFHGLTQLYILKVTSKNEFRKTINAMLVHISTLEIGSFHWIGYYINSKKPFHRTNKFLTIDGLSFSFFLAPILLVLGSIVCLLFESKLIGLSLLVISIIGLLGKLQLVRELFYSKFNLFKTDKL